MAPLTRLTKKKNAEMAKICSPHRYEALVNSLKINAPFPVRVTRSLTRVLKLIGVTLTLPAQAQKIQKRRNTSPVKALKPIASKHATRLHTIDGTNTTSTVHGPSNSHIWCICRKASFGKIIYCENPNCQIEWFHMDCLNMQTVPDGDWFCPNCRYLQ